MREEDELKACPLCGCGLLPLGGEIRDGKVIPNYIHPQYTGCALGSLVFAAKSWNSRPIEDALASELAQARQRIAELEASNEAIRTLLDIDKTVLVTANLAVNEAASKLEKKDEVLNKASQRIATLEAALNDARQRVSELNLALSNAGIDPNSIPVHINAARIGGEVKK